MDEESLNIGISDGESYYSTSTNREQEAIQRANRPIENDGRSPVDTFFYHNDGVPTDDDASVWKFGNKYENKWEWLNLLNEEHYSKSRNNETPKAEAKRDLKTWMNQLGCTTFQIERACHIYDIIPNDPDERGYVGTIRTEEVLLALVTLVVNMDGRKIREETEYQDIRDTLDVTPKQVRTVRMKVGTLL